MVKQVVRPSVIVSVGKLLEDAVDSIEESLAVLEEGEASGEYSGGVRGNSLMFEVGDCC